MIKSDSKDMYNVTKNSDFKKRILKKISTQKKKLNQCIRIISEGS